MHAVACSVLAVAMMSVEVAVAQTQWVQRVERWNSYGSVVENGDEDGGPVLVEGGVVHGWDGRAWEERSRFPANTYLVDLVLDRVRGEVVAVVAVGSLIPGTLVLRAGIWTTVATPTPYGIQDLVYDPSLGGVIALSADQTAGTTQDHLWNGSSWQPLPANVRPIHVWSSFVRDERRSRLVAFVATMALAVETWEWDGATWTQVTPAVQPPARFGAALGWDPNSQRVLLFGGNDAQTLALLTDLWEWDGTNWLQRQPATTPVAVAGYVLAWDRARRQTVLWSRLGARDYAWSGSDWIPCHEGPVDAFDAAIGTEPLRNVVVHLAAGTTSEWDGVRWRTWTGAPMPLGPLAYDISTNRMILFATPSPLGPSADTWSWNGAAWSQQFPSASPTGRTDHALLSWLPGGVVLFGGLDVTTAPLADTWLWSNGTWTDLTPTLSVSPPGGQVQGASGLLGQPPILVGQNELWQWNGNWTLLDANVPEVFSAALGVDTAGTPLLLGPDRLGHAVHEFRNGTWSRRQGPPVRDARLQRVPLRGNVIAFSSYGNYVRTDLPAEEAAIGAGCGAPAPRIVGEGVPTHGNADYRLGADVAALAPVFFVMDFQSATVPLGAGCVQHVAFPNLLGVAIAAANGTAALPLPLPLDPALRGLAAFAQVATVQPGGPLGGIAVSGGLRIRVGD